MALLITADGIEFVVTPADGVFTLHELYALIGNGCDLIEVVYLADRTTVMILDEEGKYRQPLAVRNSKATVLLKEAGGIPGDVVLGNVVLASPEEFD